NYIILQKQLAKALAEPVESLFKEGGKDTWLSIRNLLIRETEAAVSEFLDRIAGFELEKEETVEQIQQILRDRARKVVEDKAREGAGKVLSLMKDRFFALFRYDNDSLLRVWTQDEDIGAITRDALSASLKLLSNLAAIRLEEKPDNIDSVLYSLLSAASSSVDPLASSTWEEVSPEDTLISPVECMSLWTQFEGEIKDPVEQAMEAQ
ncbi:protein root hair defective 3, partial [Trifolium pratense]